MAGHSTLRKVGTCTVIAPTGARYVFRSRIGWTSGMCLRIDRARRHLRQPRGAPWAWAIVAVLLWQEQRWG